MTKDAEPTPNVELVPLVTRVAQHPELDREAFERAAMESDAAQQSGDYAGALAGAQTLLVGLVRDVAYELRRPPGESVTAFRLRKRPEGSVRRHGRFLVHKRLLNDSELQNAQRAAAMADVPGPESGVSVEAWSRLGRRMVLAAVDQLLRRFGAWQAGCRCDDGGPVELVLFQPLDGRPMYERAICRRCRCPRRVTTPGGSVEVVPTSPAVPPVASSVVPPAEAVSPVALAVGPTDVPLPAMSVDVPRPTSPVYGGTDTPVLPAEWLRSPFRLVMSVLHGVRREVWHDDGYDPVLPLPQAVADVLNGLRRFEWVELPAVVEDSLRRMDARLLMMTCVRSVALLHGRVGAQRALRRLRRQQKRQRQVLRKRAQLAGVQA
ncbi:MAG: hypothetical protein PVJ57_22260 [Phycisphaerae bacterium]|jgi:hypothetical protein